MQSAESKRTLAVWLAAFFLAALGAKLWTIQLWTTNLPFWDQWDEARLLFKPWLEGTLTWSDFFIPHNEHRIVFTRLLDLLEVKLNGQWDIYLQTVVNAIIHLAFGCGLIAAIWNFTRRKHAGLICFLLLPFFALPFAAENTIHGFQSQFYFTNLFSVAAILGLGFCKPCSGAWFGGLLAAVLAIFTMASGFLAAAAIIGLMILRAVKHRGSDGGGDFRAAKIPSPSAASGDGIFPPRGISQNEILTALCGLAVIALGLAVKVSVAQHTQLQSATAADFLATLLENLAWPFGQHAWLLLLTCAPLALLAVNYFRGKIQNLRATEFVLALAGWSFLSALVLAYGRARIAESSRYLDALAMLPLANSAALFVIAAENTFAPRLKKFALPLALLWSGILIFGQVQSSRAVAETYLEGTRGWGLAQVENVRAFLATGDEAVLRNAPREAKPYWSNDWLIEILHQPKLVALLPTEFAAAAKINAPTGRGSTAALWLVDHAVFFLCAGLFLSALLAASALRQPGISPRNSGLAWLCVLLLALTVGIGAFCYRGVDRMSYAASLHKKLAMVYANSGRTTDALIHFRAALALQPGDVEAQKSVEILTTRNTIPPAVPAQ